MHRINQYPRVVSKVCLILVYLVFYCVQLDIHFDNQRTVSFFSEEYSLRSHHKIAEDVLSKDIHQDTKPVSFRLNKRFHPEDLFTALVALQDFIPYTFSLRTFKLIEQQQLNNYSFNSPSLRGPPWFV
jgi:hypothetical protein